ncbi:hypothetical protein ACHAXR_012540 [Thalassiosira sp. AJA248-18]
MAGAKNNDEEGGNPYLAMREAKIARNQERLRELGLLIPPPLAVATPARTKKRPPKPKPIVLALGPVRRSSRLSSQTKPDYKDPADVVGRKRPRSPPAIALLDTSSSTAITVAKRAAAPATTPTVPAANSVRTIDLDVKAFLFGKEDDNDVNNINGLLGKMMEFTGKEFVINESFSRAAALDDQQRLANTKLSFNKYCGVQEWRNTIFLWVNLGTADSPNEFLEGGKQVTWFGGSRMHDESPVVHKMIRFGKEEMRSLAKKTTNEEEEASAKANNVDSNNTIVLWCRRYQPEVKKFSPYVCFGRMGYRSHVPGSRPLSFVLELLDYDGLKCHDHPAVRETFDMFTKK